MLTAVGHRGGPEWNRAGTGLRSGLALALAVLIAGCAGQGGAGLARQHQLDASVLRGDPFLHQVLTNTARGELLHVYIEGDGRPWLTPERIARDPTPERLLMLELMSLDSAPSAYLGRPCYFDLEDPACSARWWTDRRYSSEVVQSLDRVLDQLVQGHAGLVLIGHSGGGTLAMLLAARREDVRTVVTLAANLDTRAWAEQHDYTPLYGSLDPALEPPLGQEIVQLHLIGELDSVITVPMLRSALREQSDPEIRVLPGVDHRCCWPELWPDILSDISVP
jgi:pimeloyl-ACP methyl ester carboxylesterase